MPSRPPQSNPPLTEVVLAVGFRAIPGMRFAQLADLYDSRFRAAFPKVQEQARYEMPLEGLGTPTLGQLAFNFLEQPPFPRLWFLDESETHLVQVQNDWLARNWRRGDEVGSYPRFEGLRESLRSDLKAFADFVEANGFGNLDLTQSEVTYINHVLLDEGTEISDVLSLVRPATSKSLAHIEAGAVNLVSPILDGTRRVGTLRFAANTAERRTDGAPVLVINLTARGVANLGTSPLDFLEVGHDAVIDAFWDLTTAKIRTRWGSNA
jgi:uncharacterized protein (TIGR04255 family)